MTLPKFLKLWVPQAPETWGAVGTPNFLFFLSFTAAEGGGKGGTEGAVPQEGEGNPAEGGYFASLTIIWSEILCM